MKTLQNAFNVINQADYNVVPVSEGMMGALFSDINSSMLIEPATLEDVDSTYLIDAITCEDTHIFAAITTRKNRLERTMRALIKSLNASLTGTDIVAGADAVSAIGEVKGRVVGDAIVSKPRKAGLVAIMSAEIPLSDGQSVFIIFHAPDDDPLKITDEDTLIAFRFLLNKRDITHVVAPNNGRDISLKQTTQAIANVVERNSEKFKENKKIAADNKAALERLQEEVETTILKTDAAIELISVDEKLATQYVSQEKNIESSIASQLGVNEQLQTRIDQLKSEQAEKTESARKASLMDVDNLTEQLAVDIVNKLDGSFSSERINALQEMGYTALEALKINNTAKQASDNGMKATLPSVDEFLSWVEAQGLSEGDYDPRANIKLIESYAKEFDIKASTSMAYNVEAPHDDQEIIKINVVKDDLKGFFQMFADGKSALFDEKGERFEKIGQYSVYSLYSNDSDTAYERVKVFAQAAADLKSPAGGEIDNGDEQIKRDIMSQVAVIGQSMIEELKKSTSSERVSLSPEFKSKLNSIANNYNDDEKERLDLYPIVYARGSLFLDTAIVELQNGGYLSPEQAIEKALEAANDDLETDEEGEGDDSTNPTHESPTLTRTDVGADSVDVIEQTAEQSNTDTVIDATVDPELISVQRDIDKMEAQRDNMKLANRAVQKFNRAKDKDKALEVLKADFNAIDGYSENSAQAIVDNPNYMGKITAHESWELTNLGARIKSRKEKLQELESRLENAAQGNEEYDLTVDGFSVTVAADYDDDRIRVFFNDLNARPTPDDAEYPYIQKIKGGFNWSKANGAWQRKITDNARYATARAFGFDNWDDMKKAHVGTPSPAVAAVEAPLQENEPTESIESSGTSAIDGVIEELKTAIVQQSDIDALIATVESAAEQIEAENLMHEYEPLLNEASDRITALLEQA